MKRIYRLISMILVPVVLNFTIGCSYFKSKNVNHPEPVITIENIALSIQKNDYVILHFNNSVAHLKSPDLNQEQNTISGVLEPVSPEHSKFLTVEKKVNRYRQNKGQSVVENEIHIYTQSSREIFGEPTTIALDSITRIDVYDPARGVGFAYFLLSVVAVIGSLALVVSATSCPFVYIDQGKGYEFRGELFAGKIYKSLEDDDYLLLGHNESIKGLREIAISNELLETDYINYAELIAIDHPAGSQIIPDRLGNFLSISSAQQPLTATSKLGNNILDQLVKPDSSYFRFNEVTENHDEFNEAIISFAKPYGSKKAKLVIRAKSSIWIDYLWGEFAELFGGTYEGWAKDQGEISASEHVQWCKDQGIPLQVFMEKNGQWEFVDYFNTPGPMTAKDMILEMDISDVKTEQLKIKLTGGFNYWELDYVAVDYSDAAKFTLHKSIIKTAEGNTVNNLLPEITSADDQRIILQERGESVFLTFEELAPSLENRTVYLHAKGYYEHQGKGTGLPNLVQLQQFKRPSAFNKFSIQQMFSLTNKYKLN